MDEVDLHSSGLVVICPNETSQEFHSMSIETRGDLTVYLGGNQMTGLQEEITAWDRLAIAPRCFEDAKHWDLMETLCKKSEERYLSSYTRTCFVADAIIEEESEEMTPDEQEELTVMEKEQLMLDQLALPGAPLQEAERRALWRRLPQRTRVAIRRLHRQFGHPKTEFEFNACVGIDVAECKGYAGNKYSVMSMADISTGFHVARVVKEGGTMPTSESCAKALMEGWTSWAGWPKMVTMDREVHNRGNMQKLLASHGCEVVYAPLETPSAIGKVERSQGVMKAMLRKVVADTESSGLSSFETCLYETLTTKNSMTRQSGYSPAQWVLGRNPRTPGSVTDLDEAGNLGLLESKFDSSAQFFLQHQARMAAQRAFVHLDTSSRVARALTRNAAVQSQEYSVGDLVCYRRDTQAGGTQRSTACRIIGHDPHQGVWLLHEGVPVLCSAAKLRSANEAESLAYSLMNSIPALPEVIVSGPQQQKYIKVVEEKESSSSSARGQKRDPEVVESRDKTGKSARQAPKTPGALEGDVMMAELETKDHWRVSGRCAIRMHVEPRFHDFSPLHEGGMPEGFAASNACKVRKVFQDGSQKDCEVILGLGNQKEVESQAWTGFTIF